MSLHPQEIPPVPEETARVARAILPQGNRYLLLRDELGTIFLPFQHVTHLLLTLLKS
jgi:transposase